MHFTRAFLALALPLLAAAQGNPVNNSASGYGTVQAGASVPISWNPTTQGTVSILLRNGPAAALNAGTTLASGIANTGSTTVTIPRNVVNSGDYVFEIVSDSNTSNVNYSNTFTIAGGSGSVSSSASASRSSGAASTSTIVSSSSSSAATTISTTTLSSSAAATSSSASSTRTASHASSSSAAPQSTLKTGAAAPLRTGAPVLAGALALGALLL